MLELDMEEFRKAIDAMKSHTALVDKIMEPFVGQETSRKKLIELRHLANFILNSELDINIDSQIERPDFIIEFENEKIGLEHEQVFDEQLIAFTNSISTLFDGAAKVFTKKYPNITFLAEFYLSTEEFDFKKAENEKIHEEIADFAYRKFLNDVTATPWYIDRVRLSPHSQLSFCFNPGGYIVRPLPPEALLKAINKKEKRIEEYQNHSKLSSQWLLLVTGAVSPASFEFGLAPFNIEINSKFKRIYLMDESKYNVWQLF